MPVIRHAEKAVILRAGRARISLPHEHAPPRMPAKVRQLTLNIQHNPRKLRDFVESLPYVPGAVAATLRILHGTCRFKYIGLEYLRTALSENKAVIAAFWHFAFPAVVYCFRDHNLLTIVSPSKDGEVAAGLVKGLGYTPFRGSPGKGGAKAVRQFISALDNCRGGGFPADGSQGPARVAQKGLPFLAMHARSPLLPVSMAADRCWRLRSWDRTVVAKPFSRVVMAFGPPIVIERGASQERLEEYRIELEKSLNHLSDIAVKAVSA